MDKTAVRATVAEPSIEGDRMFSYRGPRNNHWPQNSIAVMTGLLRFGVNRLPFRDEVGSDGKGQRLFGRYGSVAKRGRLIGENGYETDREKRTNIAAFGATQSFLDAPGYGYTIGAFTFSSAAAQAFLEHRCHS